MSEHNKEPQGAEGYASYGMPPPPPWPYHPHMMPPGFYHHPGMPPHMAMPPGMHPHWPHYPPAPEMQGAEPPQPEISPEQKAQHEQLMNQAQQMLEGALGEEVGIFKELLGAFGMNDKEFWKGAMVGAAAALILSNDKVRGSLMGMLAGAGDMLKSGGESVKESATQTASNVKEKVNTGSEIFRDTVAAGKEGYKASVERHSQPQADDDAAPTEPETQA